MALQEGAETDQGHAVLAVQRAGDFIQQALRTRLACSLVRSAFSAIAAARFWFTHSCLFDGLLFFVSVLSSQQRSAHRSPPEP